MLRIPRSPFSARRTAQLARYARENRARPTASETALWTALVSAKLGVSFRRQVVIGSHVADFAAASIRLAVEVDGGYHASRRATDARRDGKLRRLGYHVLRLEAAMVERDLPRAVALVREAIERLAR
jgi:very-short-patch-repair endonuclease